MRYRAVTFFAGEKALFPHEPLAVRIELEGEILDPEFIPDNWGYREAGPWIDTERVRVMNDGYNRPVERV